MNDLNTDENSRPFGFWLKAVDRLMAIEFAAAFESEGITRREWRLLNVIDGTTPGDHHKSDLPLPEHKLGKLIELGWVTDAEGTWALTDDGRAAKERLDGIVDSIRAKVTDAVPAEDLATTMTTLEQIARAFGWDEATPLPRGRGRGFKGGYGFKGDRDFGHERDGFSPGRHGFGPGRHGFAHPSDGFGHERGFGHGRHGFAHPSDGFGDASYEPHHFEHEGDRMRGMHDSDACAHGRPRGHQSDGGPRSGGHTRARFARFTQGAYERGFDAGFTRGSDER